MTTRVPFRIDRSRPRSLVGQMTDGLRDAIVTGYYKPGDVLPTIHEWTRMYEVSIRVPEGAIANLVKEGLVVTRPRHGCVVLGGGRQTWRGHVLLVRPVGSQCHYVTEQQVAAEQSLSMAGYLVTTVVVRLRPDLGFDLSGLQLELSRNVGFAVVFGNQEPSLDCLARSNTPFAFVDFGSNVSVGGRCAGHVETSFADAIDEFVLHCVRAGARRVAVVSKESDEYGVADKLAAAGMRVTSVVVDAARGPTRVENLERESCRAIDRLFAKYGRRWIPDVIFVEDDYQAIGVLFSLFAHGVKMPGDVCFATIKNYGSGPALPDLSLTCVEYDPAETGREVGNAVARHLEGGKFALSKSVSAKYMIGDSFPDKVLHKKETKR